MKKLVLKCDKCGREEEIIANDNGTFYYDDITIRTVHSYMDEVPKLINPVDDHKSWVMDLCMDCAKKWNIKVEYDEFWGDNDSEKGERNA